MNDQAKPETTETPTLSMELPPRMVVHEFSASVGAVELIDPSYLVDLDAAYRIVADVTVSAITRTRRSGSIVYKVKLDQESAELTRR